MYIITYKPAVIHRNIKFYNYGRREANSLQGETVSHACTVRHTGKGIWVDIVNNTGRIIRAGVVNATN
jgi:hypothetical protein